MGSRCHILTVRLVGVHLGVVTPKLYALHQGMAGWGLTMLTRAHLQARRQAGRSLFSTLYVYEDVLELVGIAPHGDSGGCRFSFTFSCGTPSFAALKAQLSGLYLEGSPLVSGGLGIGIHQWYDRV